MGGMGEVYRARDTNLKRDVALKVLPEAFARDSGRRMRFQREAEVLASLNHPNIATIHGVEEHALVMELVEGESPKGLMPFEEARKIAMQIAGALEYAHERGIVHRDLKPANIKVYAGWRGETAGFRTGESIQRSPGFSIRRSSQLAHNYAGCNSCRNNPGHRRVHGPRTGQGQACRQARRHLVMGRDAV
jgi:hypothetical protein